jgi:hypothetical protein
MHSIFLFSTFFLFFLRHFYFSTKFRLTKHTFDPIFIPFAFGWFGVICCGACCFAAIKGYLCGSNEIEVNNRSTLEPSQTSTQYVPTLAYDSVATLQSMNSCNLRTPEIQSLVRDIPLRNIAPSVEQQPPQYANPSTRRETATSLEQQIPMLPPAYDDCIDRNSITITIEQQSLSPSPPTYDEFMQRN